MSEAIAPLHSSGIERWRPPPGRVSLRARLTIAIIRRIVLGLKKKTTESGIESFDIAKTRQKIARAEEMLSTLPADAMLTPADTAPVPSDWIEMPPSEDHRAVLYVHGGSFCLERTKVHDALIARVCRAARAKALIVDYRLAPEDPCPASIEDTKAAYRWMLDQGHDPNRVVVLGESAGGNIALAAMQELRDEGTVLPAAMVLLAPWVDLTLSGDSILGNLERDPMVSSLEGMMIATRLYLQGKEAGCAQASPLFGDMQGLPPTLLQVGGADILRDDTTRLAVKLKDAGVPVWCDVYPDMPHVWQRFGVLTPESRRAIEEVGVFVRQMLPDPALDEGALH